MGSVEVYDPKQQKWVPYIPDYDKWYQHFKDLRDGYVQPDHLGRYVVGVGERNRKLQEDQRPVVKLVSPVAQAVEMAKSEMERESKNARGNKRKKETTTHEPVHNRFKRYAYSPEDQV